MSEGVTSPKQQQPQKFVKKKYLTETEDQCTDDEQIGNNNSPPNIAKKIKGMTMQITRTKKVFSLKLLQQ
jgi:hypothetical protein